MRIRWVGGVVLCLLAMAAFRGGHSQEKVKTVMRVKLDHSQSALEGLAIEDFGMIQRSAEKMTLLSQESDWNVIQTPDYARLSDEFRRGTRKLSAAAANQNLDGATLAYVQITMKCVECHKYVREVQVAR